MREVGRRAGRCTRPSRRCLGRALRTATSAITSATIRTPSPPTGRASRPTPGCARPAAWVWVRQVHGARVVERRRARRSRRPSRRARHHRAAAAARVVTADCAPLVARRATTRSRSCTPAIAGSRRASSRRRSRASARGERGRPVRAFLGPCIRPARYEFGAATSPRSSHGSARRSRAARRPARPALDIPPASASRSAQRASTTLDDCGVCTSASSGLLLVPARRRRPAARRCASWRESRMSDRRRGCDQRRRAGADRRARHARRGPRPRTRSRSSRSRRPCGADAGREALAAGVDRPRREPRPGARRQGDGRSRTAPAPRWHFIGAAAAQQGARASPPYVACGSRSTATGSAPRSRGARPARRCSCRSMWPASRKRAGARRATRRRSSTRCRGSGLASRPHDRAARRRRSPPVVRRAARAGATIWACIVLSMGMSGDFEAAIAGGRDDGAGRPGDLRSAARSRSRGERRDGRRARRAPAGLRLEDSAHEEGVEPDGFDVASRRWSGWGSWTTTSTTARTTIRRRRLRATTAGRAGARARDLLGSRRDASDAGRARRPVARAVDPQPMRAANPSRSVAVPRDEPSPLVTPRPAGGATSSPAMRHRCTSMEPKGFNDAQEVGDRLKAGQPVDPQPAGRRPRSAAPAHRLLERARVRAERHDVEGGRPGVPADPVERRGLRRGEGAPAGARPVSGLPLCDFVCCGSRASTLVVLAARAILSWFPVRPGTSVASICRVLARPDRAGARDRSGASSRPRGCSTSRSSSSSSCSSSSRASSARPVGSRVRGGFHTSGGVVSIPWLSHGGHPP